MKFLEIELYRGKDGPVTLTTVKTSSAFAKEIFKAAKEMGYSLIDEASNRTEGYTES